LEHLNGVTGLDFLELTGTQITDAGLEHLKGLTNLAALSLTDTQVSGSGLKHLKGLTGLRYLILDDGQVTDAADFTKALPDCRIYPEDILEMARQAGAL